MTCSCLCSGGCAWIFLRSWWEQCPCWSHIRSSSRTCLIRSARRRIGSSDSPAMHYPGFPFRPARRRAAGRRTCPKFFWFRAQLLEVPGGLGFEFVVRPEGIVESKIPVLFCIVHIEQPGGIPHHFHAQLTAQIDFSLVEGTNSHSYLHAHSIKLISRTSKPVRVSNEIGPSGPPWDHYTRPFGKIRRFGGIVLRINQMQALN